MKRTCTRQYRFIWIVVSGLVWAGCQAPAPGSRPVTTAPLPEEQVDPGSAVVSPEEVSLFGDHPDAERVPYENRLLTNMTQHTFSAEGRDFDPDLLDDGNTMVFASTRNAEKPDIFLKRVDGYAITQLTSDPADDIQPRFSPDGQKVVFCSSRSGSWDIWLINRDGTELTQLTHDQTDEMAPCFSPDGERVAFTVWGSRSHQWEIWLLSVNRPGTRRFLCYGMFPDFSPDGKRIAFQRARQRGTRWFSVWSVELIDGEARHPTELAYSDSTACIAPRWSPQGDTIVYCAVRQSVASDGVEDLVADVWMVDAQSGTRVKITDGSAGAFSPTWSNTGRVYFVSARSGAENIWSLKTDVGSYPVGRQEDGIPEISRASANTPVKVQGK